MVLASAGARIYPRVIGIGQMKPRACLLLRDVPRFF
jgi:hypothetical protein